MEEHIVASASERAALAKRFSLLDLPHFEARLSVDHAEDRMLAVTGRLFAEAVQPCVVTLEPVTDHIKEEINVLFAPPQVIDKCNEGPLGDLGGDYELPEPIVNGIIDLGELAAQHLAVALNPYPRKAGAQIGVIEVRGKEKKNGAAPASTYKPFEVLAGLKVKDKS